jgi:hypothetical protein
MRLWFVGVIHAVIFHTASNVGAEEPTWRLEYRRSKDAPSNCPDESYLRTALAAKNLALGILPQDSAVIANGVCAKIYNLHVMAEGIADLPDDTSLRHLINPLGVGGDIGKTGNGGIHRAIQFQFCFDFLEGCSGHRTRKDFYSIA